MIHLSKCEHDGGAETWCGQQLSLAERAEGVSTTDIDEATCLSCLEDAREFGSRAARRHTAVCRSLGPDEVMQGDIR